MLRLILAAVIVTTPPAAAGSEEAAIARIESGLLPAAEVIGKAPRRMRLQDRMEHYKTPGVSLAVIDAGRIVWSRGYGVKKAGADAAVTPDTLFQAASISKPVTAAAALSLVARGKLSLDSPANRHLRSWKVPDSDIASADLVTLRGLLSHSAGLTVSGFVGYSDTRRLPTLLEVLDGGPPANSDPVRIALPVGHWSYSGGGYSVTQLMIEEATGQSFATAMRALALAPLNMHRSTFEQPLHSHLAMSAAVGHMDTGRPVSSLWHTYPEQAAAGLWTTPNDLARFALWMMPHTQTAPEHSFVRSALLQLQPNLDPGRGERMGLGFFLRDSGSAFQFSHGGANVGYRAMLVGFPHTRQGAVIMTNGDNAGELIRELLRSIAAEYRWPDSFRAQIAPMTLTRAQLGKLAGSYRTRDGERQRLRFSVHETTLFVHRAGETAKPLVPIGSRTFIEPEKATRYGFGRATLEIRPFRGDAALATRQTK